ncbi:hypothetical protein B0H14DRAFT_2588205 [Mycena olivaceomarginata]|nr:hypothetical protein B0H14DRAFT_2588205 [Mycena olivaceomarginata]
MALCTDWSVSGIIWPSLLSTTITSQDSLTSGLFVYSFWNLGGLSNNRKDIDNPGPWDLFHGSVTKVLPPGLSSNFASSLHLWWWQSKLGGGTRGSRGAVLVERQQYWRQFRLHHYTIRRGRPAKLPM